MTAKEYLSQYISTKHRIECLMLEREEWMSKAQMLTRNSGSSSSTPSADNSKLPKIVEKIFDIERSIDEEIDKAAELMAEIEIVISKVADNELRCLLKLRYLNELKIAEISEHMHYSTRHIKRLHKAALEAVRCP